MALRNSWSERQRRQLSRAILFLPASLTASAWLVSVAKHVRFRASRVIAQVERALRRAFAKRAQGDGGPTRPLHL
jgi:hypothetical protein